MQYVGIVDVLTFVLLAVAVIGLGLWKSRGEKLHSEHGAQDYFLAGRGLRWWLVGFSLIAANISTEQFVGMSGKAADWLGMAIASYEWMAAITLVIVAFLFVPTFLRSGIYTIPEFLEYRYNAFARLVMAVATLIILVGVPTASVIFSGAKVITGNFQGVVLLDAIDFGSITVACWIIGTVAAAYVFAGGLKACAWTDLMWGSGLILGGVIIAYKAMQVLGQADPADLVATAANGSVTAQDIADAGPLSRFWQLNQAPLPDGKLHMVRGADDPEVPWTALVLGLWIPNFFYWGLNQYITQRTLGSKSLAEGQRGVVFAAGLKLVIPFVVVIPGILAFNLFNDQLHQDAVNSNALVLSERTPALYQSLSDDIKPSQIERNKPIIEKINEQLTSPEADAGVCVYAFDAAFVELHRTDAQRIIEHNQRIAAQAVPDLEPFEPGASAEALEHYNSKLLAAVGSDDPAAGEIDVETLVPHDYDNAFPTLIRELLPVNRGIKGFVLVAIFGAVVSSLASMLNSASTIATMDIYRRFRPVASQYELVTAGRVFVVLFVLIAMIIAPMLGSPAFGGIFTFIQEFQGFISPGILSIFLFGLLIHRAPRYVGTVGLLLNPVLYGLFKFSPRIFGEANPRFLEALAGLSFLDRMAVCFVIVLAVLATLTLINPLKKPVDLPVNPAMDMTQSKGAKLCGGLVVIATLALYVIFW